MTPALIISIAGFAITIGGICIAIGVFKGKVTQNAEINKAQEDEMKKLATKDELAQAIARSDEMLDIMRKRAEEDREKGQSQWHEFHKLLSDHESRIKVIESQQTSMIKTLDEIKLDIKDGFRDLHKEIKEWRNQN